MAQQKTIYTKDGILYKTFSEKKNENQRIVVTKNGKINEFIKFKLTTGKIVNHLQRI